MVSQPCSPVCERLQHTQIGWWVVLRTNARWLAGWLAGSRRGGRQRVWPPSGCCWRAASALTPWLFLCSIEGGPCMQASHTEISKISCVPSFPGWVGAGERHPARVCSAPRRARLRHRRCPPASPPARLPASLLASLAKPGCPHMQRPSPAQTAACLPVRLPARPPAHLPASLAQTPSCLPAHLLACLPARRHLEVASVHPHRRGDGSARLCRGLGHRRHEQLQVWGSAGGHCRQGWVGITLFIGGAVEAAGSMAVWSAAGRWQIRGWHRATGDAPGCIASLGWLSDCWSPLLVVRC